MAFIGAGEQGQVYAPGYFLAHEECVRETRQIAQSGATTATDGAKYVKMGTAYPSNDSNAIGIVYEDVDVTNGDMPGSVVTKGIVYEDRLAVTDYNYNSVTVGNFVSPKDQKWYERSGAGSDQSPYVYTLSTDTTANVAKTYYAKDGDTYNSVTVGDFVSPVAQGWYESDGGSGYVASDDTQADGSKTYYAQSTVRISSNAKTALAALGFKFIAQSPAVERP